VATSALASVKWNRANAAEEAPKKAESLFVQTSKERSPEFAPRTLAISLLLFEFGAGFLPPETGAPKGA